MSLLRLCAAPLLAAPLLFLAGCNYVHFGKAPRGSTDTAVATENSDLRTEKKLLQQELALARKEGDALRDALNNRYVTPGAANEDLVRKLNDTSRELATLRTSYTKLQADRERLAAGPATAGANQVALEQIASLRTQLGANEEKLAATLRTFTQLQEENARLRSDVDKLHTDNSALLSATKQATAQNAEAQTAISQLNTELLAQKEARRAAENEAQSLRAQLHAVMERSRAEPGSSITTAAESPATLRVANLPPPSAPATAVLRTNPTRVRTAATAATAPAPTPTPAPAPDFDEKSSNRIYVVVEGDTLERIARKFYGRPDKWSRIYAANNRLLSGGRSIKPGMELEIPLQ